MCTRGFKGVKMKCTLAAEIASRVDLVHLGALHFTTQR